MNFLASPILRKLWVEVKRKLKFEESIGAGRSWGSGGWEAGVEQPLRPCRMLRGRETWGGWGEPGHPPGSGRLLILLVVTDPLYVQALGPQQGIENTWLKSLAFSPG